MIDVEKESLKDLERIVSETKKWGLKLVIIGGYAVIAHIGKYYRATKDIDFVAPKARMGTLRGLLKEFGYDVHSTQFGLKGRKKLNGGSINLDISIEEVFDVSTQKKYTSSRSTFLDSKMLEVGGRTKETENMKVKARVISLEELFLLKLMTKGRDKDTVDVISLLMDKSGEVNVNKFAEHCSRAGLKEHIRGQILNFIGLVRRGDARKIWFTITGKRLMLKTEAEIIRFLRMLANELR
jgi:hypothetical protein